MIVVFRPQDMTPQGKEAFKTSGRFSQNHLKYNQQVYLNKADEAFYTEKEEGGLWTEMLQVKFDRRRLRQR